VELDQLLDAARHAPEAALRACLEALVAEVGVERSRELLEQAAAGDPASPDLEKVATTVAQATDVESLTRPLLEALHGVTGMASTYLTVIHDARDVQEIRYSLNTLPGFALPEGLEVPWADTHCKRALDEGRPATTDVPAVWGDSEAAAALGIQTYVSVPIRLADGTVWGTLCGADACAREDAERHLPTLGMFARLIAAEVERSATLSAWQSAAEVDALTGCASRRGIDAWLREAAEGDADTVVAVFVDLDGFKQVNDELGHAAGDTVLRAVGEHLRRATRAGDLVGRFGGDEFVVAAALPSARVAAFLERWADQLSLEVELPDRVLSVRGSIGTAAAPPRAVADLLVRADREMYTAKQQRRGGVALA
jgi:diguanylate cyclase